MGYQKLFNDRANKIRECGSCRGIKPYTHFSAASTVGSVRSVCKPCRSLIQSNRVLEERKNKYPDNYLECTSNDCMNIWDREIDKWCPKCGYVGCT